MISCAPDLMEGPAALMEQNIRNTYREGLNQRRLPRPRFAAAFFTLWAFALNPSWLLQMFLWSLVLFLTASVALGPERARDGINNGWAWFRARWKVEKIWVRNMARDIRSLLSPSARPERNDQNLEASVVRRETRS